jgi:hypothetical protein
VCGIVPATAVDGEPLGLGDVPVGGVLVLLVEVGPVDPPVVGLVDPLVDGLVDGLLEALPDGLVDGLLVGPVDELLDGLVGGVVGGVPQSTQNSLCLASPCSPVNVHTSR